MAIQPGNLERLRIFGGVDGRLRQIGARPDFHVHLTVVFWVDFRHAADSARIGFADGIGRVWLRDLPRLPSRRRDVILTDGKIIAGTFAGAGARSGVGGGCHGERAVAAARTFQPALQARGDGVGRRFAGRGHRALSGLERADLDFSVFGLGFGRADRHGLSDSARAALLSLGQASSTALWRRRLVEAAAAAQLRAAMPFGPMLAIGAVAALLFGVQINAAYWKLMEPQSLAPLAALQRAWPALF